MPWPQWHAPWEIEAFLFFSRSRSQKYSPIIPILWKYVLGIIGWYKVDAIKMPKIGAGGDIPRPLARGEQVSGEIQHDYSFWETLYQTFTDQIADPMWLIDDIKILILAFPALYQTTLRPLAASFGNPRDIWHRYQGWEGEGGASKLEEFMAWRLYL